MVKQTGMQSEIVTILPAMRSVAGPYWPRRYAHWAIVRALLITARAPLTVLDILTTSPIICAERNVVVLSGGGIVLAAACGKHRLVRGSCKCSVMTIKTMLGLSLIHI